MIVVKNYLDPNLRTGAYLWGSWTHEADPIHHESLLYELIQKGLRDVTLEDVEAGQLGSWAIQFAPRRGSMQLARNRKWLQKKREEFGYLYAAQAHCLQCLENYGTLANVDLHCASQGKGARQWAQANAHRNMGCEIPRRIEEWLSFKEWDNEVPQKNHMGMSENGV